MRVTRQVFGRLALPLLQVERHQLDLVSGADFVGGPKDARRARAWHVIELHGFSPRVTDWATAVSRAPPGGNLVARVSSRAQPHVLSSCSGITTILLQVHRACARLVEAGSV